MLCMSHPKIPMYSPKASSLILFSPCSSFISPLIISRLLFAFFFFLSIFAKSDLLAQELIFELENLFGVELFGIGLGSLLGVKSPQATRLVLVAI